jgi:hypothetical protein
VALKVRLVLQGLKVPEEQEASKAQLELKVRRVRLDNVVRLV